MTLTRQQSSELLYIADNERTRRDATVSDLYTLARAGYIRRTATPAGCEYQITAAGLEHLIGPPYGSPEFFSTLASVLRPQANAPTANAIRSVVELLVAEPSAWALFSVHVRRLIRERERSSAEEPGER